MRKDKSDLFVDKHDRFVASTSMFTVHRARVHWKNYQKLFLHVGSSRGTQSGPLNRMWSFKAKYDHVRTFNQISQVANQT